MDSIAINSELELTLTGSEVATLIEASMDALYKRLYWSVTIGHRWRDIDLGYAAKMIEDLQLAHTKLYLSFRELGHLHDEFDEAFTVPDDVYELIDQIEKAASWDDIPTHRHNRSLCKLCKTLTRAP